MSHKALALCFYNEQAQYWLQSKQTKETTLVTEDIVTLQHCEENKIDCCDIWSFINHQDTSDAFNASWELMQTWWQSALGKLQYEGVFLGEVFQYDMLLAFIGTTLWHRVFPRILKQFQPERIYLFVDFQNPTIWDGPYGPLPDSLNAVSYWMAKKEGITICPLTLGKEKYKHPSYYVDYSPFLENLTPVLPAIINKIEHPDSKRKRILFWVDSFVIRKYRKLIEALKNNPQYQLFFVQKEEDCTFHDFENVIDLNALLSWLRVEKSYQKEIDHCWKKFKHFQKSYRGDFPYLFNNPCLDFQFKGFWNRLQYAGAYTHAAKAIFGQVQPDLCIVEGDWHGFGALKSQVAKKHGIKTLSIPHAIQDTHFNQYKIWLSRTEYHAMEGNYHKNQLISQGWQSEKVGTVGFTFEPAIGQHKQPKKPTVVLITGANLSLDCPLENLTRLRRDWVNGILKLIKKYPDWNFVHRMHPLSDYSAFYKHVSKRFPQNYSFSKNKKIQEEFSKASVVVMIGYPSSAGIEAVSAKIPFVFFHSSLFKTLENQSALSLEEIPQAATIEELEIHLKNLILDPSKREKNLKGMEAFITKWFSSPDHPSSLSAYLDFIGTILSSRPAQKREIFHPFHRKLGALTEKLSQHSQKPINVLLDEGLVKELSNNVITNRGIEERLFAKLFSPHDVVALCVRQMCNAVKKKEWTTIVYYGRLAWHTDKWKTAKVLFDVVFIRIKSISYLRERGTVFLCRIGRFLREKFLRNERV